MAEPLRLSMLLHLPLLSIMVALLIDISQHTCVYGILKYCVLKYASFTRLLVPVPNITQAALFKYLPAYSDVVPIPQDDGCVLVECLHRCLKLNQSLFPPLIKRNFLEASFLHHHHLLAGLTDSSCISTTIHAYASALSTPFTLECNVCIY